MSSDSNNKTELSEALSSLNIGGSNESNNEEKEASTNDSDRRNSVTTSICAACGKEGDGDNMNTCNKCDLVQYCYATCKKKHKSKHKKKCERRVAELYDENLFKEPQPREDCPVCFLPLPSADQLAFYSCCGKDICNGCLHAMVESNAADLCPFCRTLYAKSDEEYVNRNKILMEKGNADAFYILAGCYAQGRMGMPQDWAKANELLLKAGELGCAKAYFNLGNAYNNGEGLEVDKEKAKHYWELAAIGGDVLARYNIGVIEGQAGNYHRTIEHFILAAKVGHKGSLDMVTKGFKNGHITKDDYESTLRAYHENQR